MFPSWPRYSAGARASRSVTSGDDSNARTSVVVNRIRDWSLKRARVNVAIGEAMARAIGANAVVRHNWAAADLSLLPKHDSRFVVGYSGNLGRAHEFETMLAAARALPEVQFAITGGGAQLERVRAGAPPNVIFRDYAPRERLNESLASADVHLVSLLPSLEGLIVPSKFYGVLAVARPVLFVGAADGSLARIIRENDCGFVIQQGDGDGLVRRIRELANDRGRARAMGLRGRRLYEEQFAPQIGLAAWERILT